MLVLEQRVVARRVLQQAARCSSRRRHLAVKPHDGLDAADGRVVASLDYQHGARLEGRGGAAEEPEKKLEAERLDEGRKSISCPTAYKQRWRKIEVPASAERVWPEGEKARSWKESSLSGSASLAAVLSQLAFISGLETLIWFLLPSARMEPLAPQAPHVMAPLCLPAKCWWG